MRLGTPTDVTLCVKCTLYTRWGLEGCVCVHVKQGGGSKGMPEKSSLAGHSMEISLSGGDEWAHQLKSQTSPSLLSFPLQCSSPCLSPPPPPPPPPPLPCCLLGSPLTQPVLLSPSVWSLLRRQIIRAVCLHVTHVLNLISLSIYFKPLTCTGYQGWCKIFCFFIFLFDSHYFPNHASIYLVFMSSYRAEDHAARPSVLSPHSDRCQHVAWPQSTEVRPPKVLRPQATQQLSFSLHI